MANQWPVLVMTRGPWPERRFRIEAERASVGRSADADIRLESPTVSRRHVSLTRRGVELFVKDLGSANGTYVNGARVAVEGVLRSGDKLRVGDVELRYEAPAAIAGSGAEPSSRSYEFGDVNGPVNAGTPVNEGGNQIVGSGSIYHGDVHHGDRYEAGDVDVFQEAVSGKGPGRVLVVIGLLVAIAGFAIFASVIFSGMTSMGTFPEVGPDTGLGSALAFNKEIFGLNATVTGFSMFGVGGLLMAIGAAMSKAARRRDERRHR
jgi:FHA domain